MRTGQRREILRFVYAQNASAPSELPVLATVIDFADAELPEGGGAHDARFDRYI